MNENNTINSVGVDHIYLTWWSKFNQIHQWLLFVVVWTLRDFSFPCISDAYVISGRNIKKLNVEENLEGIPPN